MAKSVNIPVDEWIASLKAFVHTARGWVEDFFRTITTYEAIAVGAIGLGLILLIIGLIVM